MWCFVRYDCDLILLCLVWRFAGDVDFGFGGTSVLFGLLWLVLRSDFLVW